MQKKFIHQTLFKIISLLSLMTAFDISLVVFRLNWVGFVWGEISSIRDVFFFRNEPTFLFLIWNLFLAWLPFWLSVLFQHLENEKNNYLLMAGTAFCWLLFLPNAPYILTDLLHLRPRPPIPVWYDALLITSFAWTGLLLGLLSLYPFHRFLKKHLSERWTFLAVLAVLLLCSFGIFLGRFLRWNSWDVINHPKGIMRDLLELLQYPSAYFPELGIMPVLFLILTPFYFLIQILLEKKESLSRK